MKLLHILFFLNWKEFIHIKVMFLSPSDTSWGLWDTASERWSWSRFQSIDQSIREIFWVLSPICYFVWGPNCIKNTFYVLACSIPFVLSLFWSVLFEKLDCKHLQGSHLFTFLWISRDGLYMTPRWPDTSDFSSPIPALVPRPKFITPSWHWLTFRQPERKSSSESSKLWIAGESLHCKKHLVRGTQGENFSKILETSFSAFLDCFRAFKRHICVS